MQSFFDHCTGGGGSDRNVERERKGERVGVAILSSRLRQTG